MGLLSEITDTRVIIITFRHHLCSVYTNVKSKSVIVVLQVSITSGRGQIRSKCEHEMFTFATLTYLMATKFSLVEKRRRKRRNLLRDAINPKVALFSARLYLSA